MFTIVSISFGKAKTYDYLLDSRSVVKPKIGENLRIIRSITSKGCLYDNLHVVKLKQEKDLPPQVYSVIRVVSKELDIEHHKMSQKVLDKLRKSIKIERMPKKEKSTRYRPLEKPILGNLTNADLTRMFVGRMCTNLLEKGGNKYGR